MFPLLKYCFLGDDIEKGGICVSASYSVDQPTREIVVRFATVDIHHDGNVIDEMIDGNDRISPEEATT